MQFKELEWKDIISDGVTVCSHCEINLCGVIKIEPKIPNQLYICQPIASPKSSTISFWNAVIVV